jgi:predicted ATP-dependent endonuclease of OLD family
MERLIVKNFGPIKDIDIEIKDVNVLIGTTASGKSTVAKLWAIFNSNTGEVLDSIGSFTNELKTYNIDFEIKAETLIRYSDGIEHSEDSESGGEWVWDLEKMAVRNQISTLSLDEAVNNTRNYLIHSGFDNNLIQEIIGNDPNSEMKISDREILLKQLIEAFQGAALQRSMHYIPAERSVFAMIGNSIFGMLKNDVTIPECVKDFGAQFEVARKKFPELRIPMLSLTYKYENLSDYIVLDDGTKLRLSQASSGVQSVVPAYVVLHSLGETDRSYQIIIEEPELNLYPNTQKDFLEYLVRVTNKTKSKLFITTHSPYIVTALDNLLQAKNAFKAHPEKEEEISKIVDKDLWVDFANVSSYFFDKGTCESTLNQENHSLGAYAIDDVSDAIGEQFEALLKIEYAE